MRPLSPPLLLALVPASVVVAQAPGTVSGPLSAVERSTPGIVVGLSPGADLAALLAATGATVAAATAQQDIYLLQLPAGSSPEDVASLLGELQGLSGVGFAEVNQRAAPPETGCDLVPALDPGAQDCTVAFFDGEPAPEKFYDQPSALVIGMAEAEALLSGSPALVAVIDTGIDPTHPMLADHLFSTGIDLLHGGGPALDLSDGYDNDHDGLVDEAVGHGTHVSGCIVLANPNALLLPIKVLDSDGNGTSFHVAQAIIEAVLSGAQVINLSLGMTGPSAAVESAVAFAAALGVPVLAAAGNTGSASVLYPAAYPSVLAVAALDAGDKKASFSAYGEKVALCAPGTDVYSAMPGSAYAWWSGTSMATAIASGTISLAVSLHSPDDDPDGDEPTLPEEFDAIVDTAVPVDAENPGLEGLLGEGRVDVLAAALELLGL